jgi:hypothetical protein
MSQAPSAGPSIRCPGCGQPVALPAESCPACGHNFRLGRRPDPPAAAADLGDGGRGRMWIAAAGAAAVLLAFLGWFFLLRSPAPAPAPPPAAAGGGGPMLQPVPGTSENYHLNPAKPINAAHGVAERADERTRIMDDISDPDSQ